MRVGCVVGELVLVCSLVIWMRFLSVRFEWVWVEWDAGIAVEALRLGGVALGWDRVKDVAAAGCAELVDECELDESDLATEARGAIVESGVLKKSRPCCDVAL